MIVKINGTCGAGKTTVVRSILDGMPADGVMVDDGYVWESPKIALIGHYYRRDKTDPTKWRFYHTGGSDHYRKDEVIAAVLKYHKQGYDVLFENSQGSRTALGWSDIADEVGIDNMVWIYLNTSLEQCRINKTNRMLKHSRKNASLNDTMRHLDIGYECCENAKEKLISLGYRVEIMNPEEATARATELLGLPNIPFVPK